MQIMQIEFREFLESGGDRKKKNPLLYQMGSDVLEKGRREMGYYRETGVGRQKRKERS